MSDNRFSLPTQYVVDDIKIDGKGVTGLFLSLSIFENIFIPAVTGEIMLLDSDGAGFLEKEGIEFFEDFTFTMRNALDETLTFDGHLNGLKGESVKESKRVYTIEFVSKQVRENEQNFVTKRFKDVQPEEIINEMLQDKLKVENINNTAQGKPMSFLGSRRKPLDIVKYVLTHGVSVGSNTASAGFKEDGKPQNDEVKGMTGFLCWETIDEYRVATIDQVLAGEVGEQHKGLKRQLQNKGLSMKETMNGIIDYEFPRLADTQSKLRSGAFKNTVISFDMDKGTYTEYTYEDDKHMTEKQKKVFGKTSRYIFKPYQNERFSNECDKEKENVGDQSREYLSQNNIRQNTFDDQLGEFTLPPLFKIHAGDLIEVKLSKIESEKGGGYDEKHSGNYICKGVAHHFFVEAEGYTRISTIRSTTQQNDSESQSP